MAFRQAKRPGTYLLFALQQYYECQAINYQVATALAASHESKKYANFPNNLQLLLHEINDIPLI